VLSVRAVHPGNLRGGLSETLDLLQMSSADCVVALVVLVIELSACIDEPPCSQRKIRALNQKIY
jgi:hypothetical protein